MIVSSCYYLYAFRSSSLYFLFQELDTETTGCLIVKKLRGTMLRDERGLEAPRHVHFANGFPPKGLVAGAPRIVPNSHSANMHGGHFVGLVSKYFVNTAQFYTVSKFLI